MEILKKFQNIKNIKIFSLLSCLTFLYFEKRSKPKFTRIKKNTWQSVCINILVLVSIVNCDCPNVKGNTNKHTDGNGCNDFVLRSVLNVN